MGATDPSWSRRGLRRQQALLLAGVVAAYVSAFAGTFQFDDWNVIVHDPRVQSLAAWWDAMPGIRPLLKLSYALNHASGLGPAGFHAVNIALHAGNVLLVHALLARVAQRSGMAPDAARLAVFAAAAIFALHPVQTEAVTYVSGRSVSLAACLSLASLLCWVEGRENGRAGRASALAPLLFAGAMAAKETAAVLPLAALLWAATDPRRRFRARDFLRESQALWAVLALALAAAAASPTYRHLLEASLGVRGAGENLVVQAQAIAWLAGQLLRPDLLNADPMLVVDATLTPAAAFAGFAASAALGLGVAMLARRPAVAFGILWFFLWLAPTNSLLPRLDAVNDRQLYLALAGPAWLAGLGMAALAPRLRSAPALALALAVLLGAATAARNVVYWDEMRYWEDVARKAPHNARAWNNLGYAYARAGRPQDAERALARAIALAPEDSRAGVNLRLLRQGALVDVR